jgi:hypothetical protein
MSNSHSKVIRFNDRAAIRHILPFVLIFGCHWVGIAYAADEPSNKSEEILRGDQKKMSERALAAGLYWLARHQAKNGNWSLKEYTKECTDKTCSGVATQESLSAATAMGVLPMLAAGQTHSSQGPFQKSVKSAVSWLIAHQKPDGDLSVGADQQMYSHAMATIALVEDYRMTRDKTIGTAAQKAVDFIEAAQHPVTGGWRYHPAQEGDTSVLGWQLTALDSARRAGLAVKPGTLDGAKRFLASVEKRDSDGKPTGRFSYQPDGKATPTISAIGLLSNQYLKADRSDPLFFAGENYLAENMPELESRNVYYWLYATQVLHRAADANWDKWNRRVRKLLVEPQDRTGCAAGSWNPEKPNHDAWGPNGGRLMMTSFSCMILEVPVRWSFLAGAESAIYKVDAEK